MKRKLLFAALCAMSALGTLRAQSWEDVTSFYLTNADFEGSYTQQATYSSGNNTRYLYAPNGWTVTHTNKNDNDITILKSGDAQSASFKYFDFHPADGGDQAYLVRFRWGGWYWDNNTNSRKGNTDKIVLTQASTLPSGKYRLSAETAFITAEESPTGYLRIYADKSAGGSLGWKNAAITKGSRSGETISEGSASWVTTSTGEWNLDAETGVTFGIEFMQTWRWEIQAGIDNVKIERQCSEESPWDVPVAKGAWTLNTGTYEGGYVEHFIYGQPTGEYLRYTMSGVPNGYYQVKLTMKSSSTSSRDPQPAAVEDGDTKYTSIVCGDVEQAVPSYNAIDAETGASPAQYTLDYVFVDDGELKVSININEVGPNWIIAKIDGIKFYGDIPNRKAYRDALAAAQAAIANNDYDAVIGTERSDLQTAIDAAAPASTEACGTAATELETKTNTFTSAKDTYEALTREIAKAKALGIATATADGYAVTSSDNAATALANTQALKVVEYNYVTTNYQYGVTLGEWTSTGTNTKAADFNNEHWSGTTHTYKNQKDDWGNPKQGYAADSWTINFSQNVTLPAGNYIFKVAGRQASGNKVTTSLVVTDTSDDSELGSISDFPRSNSARGINKSGATAFTGENSEFANDGKGFGWEWRYVKFSLASDATVNIAINSVATASNQWVSFGDYTLQTDDDTNISLIAYNIALGSAQTVFADPQYANVTGSEKTALQTAIDADGSLDKTDKDAIDAATIDLDNARTAFTGAKPSYDALVAAKAVVYPALAYATAAKRTALDEAQAATATSASDAVTKTAAITTASRKYYESHALGEGVSAEEITIVDPRFAGLTNEDIDKANWKIGTAWKIADQNNGEIAFYTTNSLIDGDGNDDYQYIRIQKSDNNGRILQTINLEPGKYMMTAAVRCQSGQGAKFEAFAGGVWVDAPQDNNTGGIYGNGWNDVSVEFYVTETSDIEFGVKSNWGKNIWWTATRFRLVKLPTPEVAYNENTACTPEACPYANVTLTRNISANTWSTFVVPFDIDNTTLKAQFGNDVRVSEFSADDKTGVTFTPMAEPAITANVPVLLRATANKSSFTFNGVTIVAATPTYSENGVNFVGNYGGEITIPYELDTYFVKSNALKKSNGNQKIKGFRAYFTVDADSPVKAFFENGINIDDADAIGSIANDQEPMANSQIYNLAGQRMSKVQKGVNIVNGKKVLVK